MAAETPSARPARHRPRTTTVFVAAFVAGAAAAVGVNRALDVHLAQAKPQVECEPIFVALRALPSGSPITVWDVALRDLPKAMVPATALRVTDSFEGRILKFPLREGQPLVSGQLVPAEPAAPAAAETLDT
jgi:Flp pilus assembly protein CpaB